MPPHSKTIVRKVRGGTDPSSGRFVILTEVGIDALSFAFTPTGVEMTLDETFAALRERGISAHDAIALLNEADGSFEQP